jgi:GMP synthase (glutamine-hydrolysing)
MLRGAIGDSNELFSELDARCPLPELSAFSAVIVSGSPASVIERAPWMSKLAANLLRAVESGVAILGVCFGHQLLAQALGGQVEKNPRGREIGSVRLEPVTDDAILASKQPFFVNMTHVDAVLELPPGARVVARTALDPNAVIRFSERAWGVQFHPEIDAEVMLDYVEGRAETLQSEGLDVSAIRAAIRDAPAGRQVLSLFLEQARRQG